MYQETCESTVSTPIFLTPIFDSPDIGLSRDTAEPDLKQRRELRDGHVVFVDQSPVRCAVHGRILIIEGAHRAARAFRFP